MQDKGGHCEVIFRILRASQTQISQILNEFTPTNVRICWLLKGKRSDRVMNQEAC